MSGHATPAARWVLWIDGVGAFLVLLAEEVLVGRMNSTTNPPFDEADISLMGNLSRRHLTLRRAGEDYVVEPFARTSLQGRVINGSTLLPSPCELLLNDSVRLKFELCSPLSASARLEVLSNHRGRWPINGIVLMAETCLLGAGPENHIRCPQWSSQLVLVRRDGGLAVKSRGAMTINDSPCSGWVSLSHNQTVAGEGFRMRLEEIPARSLPTRSQAEPGNEN